MQARIFIATLALVAASGAALAADDPTTWEGLELRPTKGLDLVYLRPGARFQAYDSVVIDAPVEVAGGKDWDPHRGVRGVSRQLSARDVQKIRDEMSTEFRKVFTEELTGGGYAIVDVPGELTLRISASLAEVYINAPERMEIDPVTTYTVEPGRMTLQMELRDGPTGQLLARIVDEKSGTSIGPLRVTNSMTNSSDFRRAARSWARRLVEALGKVRSGN